MKQTDPITWLIFVLFIALTTACGGAPAEIDPTDLPVASFAEEDVLIPTVAPVATVPAPTETPIPLPPTHTPEPTPTTVSIFTPPDQLLIDYGTSDYGNPILQKTGADLRFEPLPAELGMEVFFDYLPAHGLLAFGRVFWEAAGPHSHSVSDLWVYDFHSDQLTQWVKGDVGRAAWSTDPTQPPTLAIALHNGESFDLVLAQEANAVINIEQDITPYFSWAPQQSRLAFIKEGQLIALNPYTKTIQKGNTAEIDTTIGWIADQPIWVLNHDTLIYPEFPLLIAPLNKGTGFVPTDSEGAPLATIRPTKMLWSAETNQLIVQVEDFISSVQIYTFTPNLQQVSQINTIDNVRLAFWYEPEQSIVLIDDFGENPQIWSLTTYDFVEP